MEQKAVDFQALTVADEGASYSQKSKWEKEEKWERKKAS